MRYPIQDMIIEDEKRRESRMKRLAQLYVECDSFNSFWLKASVENIAPASKWRCSFTWLYVFHNVGSIMFNVCMFIVPFVVLQSINISLELLGAYGDKKLELSLIIAACIMIGTFIWKSFVENKILNATKYVKWELSNKKDRKTNSSTNSISSYLMNTYKTPASSNLSC